MGSQLRRCAQPPDESEQRVRSPTTVQRESGAGRASSAAPGPAGQPLVVPVATSIPCTGTIRLRQENAREWPWAILSPFPNRLRRHRPNAGKAGHRGERGVRSAAQPAAQRSR